MRVKGCAAIVEFIEDHSVFGCFRAYNIKLSAARFIDGFPHAIVAYADLAALGVEALLQAPWSRTRPPSLDAGRHLAIVASCH